MRSEYIGVDDLDMLVASDLSVSILSLPTYGRTVMATGCIGMTA